MEAADYPPEGDDYDKPWGEIKEIRLRSGGELSTGGGETPKHHEEGQHTGNLIRGRVLAIMLPLNKLLPTLLVPTHLVQQDQCPLLSSPSF